MAILTTILKSRWTHYVLFVAAIITTLLMSYNKLQRMLLEKKQSDNRYKEMKLAYENQAKDYARVKNELTKAKTTRYLYRKILPDGTIIESVSEFVDSTVQLTESDTGHSIPVFAPSGDKQPGYSPAVAQGIITNSGWGVGAGWDLIQVTPSSLPKSHIVTGLTIGKPWNSNSNPAFLKSLCLGGVVTILFERKSVAK